MLKSHTWPAGGVSLVSKTGRCQPARCRTPSPCPRRPLAGDWRSQAMRNAACPASCDDRESASGLCVACAADTSCMQGFDHTHKCLNLHHGSLGKVCRMSMCRPWLSPTLKLCAPQPVLSLQLLDFIWARHDSRCCAAKWCGGTHGRAATGLGGVRCE